MKEFFVRSGLPIYIYLHSPCFFLSFFFWLGRAAAVMRIGLMEMKHFSEEFFEGVKPETFTETSAGIADLITTCECPCSLRRLSAFIHTLFFFLFFLVSHQALVEEIENVLKRLSRRGNHLINLKRNY